MIIIVVLGYYVTMATRTIEDIFLRIYGEYRGITQRYRFTVMYTEHVSLFLHRLRHWRIMLRLCPIMLYQRFW